MQTITENEAQRAQISEKTSEETAAHGDWQAMLETIDDADQVAEWIIYLDDYIPSLTLGDAALKALLDRHNAQLHTRAQVNALVMALGQRLNQLRHAEAAGDFSRHITTAQGLADHLLVLFEYQRRRHRPLDALKPALEALTQGVLKQVDGILPSTQAGRGRLRVLREVAEGILIPAYLNLTPHLNGLDENPLVARLMKSPYLMGALVAIPGLLSVVMPVSTPFILTLLFLMGTFIIHPLWRQFTLSRLGELQGVMAQIDDLMPHLSGEKALGPADFETKTLLNALLPQLHAHHLAHGEMHKASEKVIAGYLRHLDDHEKNPDPDDISEGSETNLNPTQRAFLLGEVAYQYDTWAKANDRLEAQTWRKVLHSPWLTCVLLTTLSLPLSMVAARISPLPQSIDLPLMILLIGLFAYQLPTWLPGTQANRERIVEELRDGSPGQS